MAGVLEKCLKAGTKKMGIKISNESLECFREYYKILDSENKKINLTAIEGEKDVAVKHFLDSLSCMRILDLDGKSVVDVGSGAGFPGIPLKILNPGMYLLIVDSERKRIDFLLRLIEKLSIKRVEAKWERAEVLGKNKDFREKADIVVSRAVANLNVLSELCLPLVKTGGYFLSMKGPRVEEELEESRKAIKLMGGEVERTDQFELPLANDRRNLIIIKKTGTTPEKYPRRAGIPAKRPVKG
jgi:16S rRNA (guanine527-N7)-methyltransferase